ncbi:MAG: hypothetical protein EBR82_18010 [Caulobacteraceae bacterium]|nr:hypothetical protein [Caulobacteraceae bacterium]
MPTTLNDAGATANFVVREGCTWSREFTATIDGAAVNLTSYTITAEITANPTSDTALKTFTVTKTNAAAGKFRISVAAADADLAPGTYWWALQWNDGTNDLALCSGSFIVKDWTL